MSSAVVNVKVDPKVKKDAQKIAGELGFSLSALVKAYLRQLIKTKKVSFSVSPGKPTGYLLESIGESEKQRKKGKVISFKNAREAIKYLDEIIGDE